MPISFGVEAHLAIVLDLASTSLHHKISAIQLQAALFVLQYPWEFRWKTVAVGSCFFCLFASVLVPLQALLERWELRKIQHKIIPSQVSI